jgi:F420-dependent oxidoreductase-like protein
MKISLMVEGQNGLNWERWLRILALAERLKFPGVFRSDHYFIGPQQDSLDPYLSFAVAAHVTSTIRFGPLVSPVTFRSPVDHARMAGQVDLLSGGRFTMGVGAGWNEPEHKAYGIDFPPVKERFERLEEGIKVMKALWAGPDASFRGKHYSLAGADMKPRPEPARPPLLIGGGGEKKTLKLVARYADEWNGVNMTPETFRHKLGVLARHCESEGRDPSTIARSMMTFGIIGPSQKDIDAATERLQSMFGGRGVSPEEFRKNAAERGMIVGTTEQVVDRLGSLAELGLGEVMFQHFNFDSDDVPEYLAAEITPRVRNL